MTKTIAGMVLVLLGIAAAQVATAEVKRFEAFRVDQVLITSGSNGDGSATFGNCMAQTMTKFTSQDGLSGCADDWVTFSCSGDFNPKDLAYRKLEQAQLAMALNKRVIFFVDNTKVHNGYCFAERFDVRR